MVWFECTDCGESLKKPKVQNHTYSCCASGFNCIDCGRTFDRHSVKEHTTCVTEHDKYAKGATKPGGFAAQGFYGSSENAKAEAPAGPSGLEFLATRPPWKCSVCNVTCTSNETLMGHAAGAKHKRRARAALANQGTGEGGGSQGNADAAQAAEDWPEEIGQAPSSDCKDATSNGKAAGKKRKHVEDAQSLPSTSKALKEDASGQAGTSSAQQAAAAQQSKGAASTTTEEKRYKWKKLAEKVLQARGGNKKMKVRKLQLKVLAAAGLSADEICNHGDAMLQRCQKSRRRFCVENGYISLKQSE
ncbi:g98 [Coccomyxa elongata]